MYYHGSPQSAGGCNAQPLAPCWVFVPVGYPERERHHHPETASQVREIAADPEVASATGFTGGIAAAHLTLDYLTVPEGDTVPLVRVTITDSDGVASTWENSAFEGDYHLKDDFPPVAPGSRLLLEVEGVVARLRWCEKIHCC